MIVAYPEFIMFLWCSRKNGENCRKRWKNDGASRGFKTMSNDKKAGVAFTVYMRREGRVTVPKELRDAYDLKEGDLVECQIKKIR
jgi:AbrB family looped-hinge helix DNA binding protein